MHVLRTFLLRGLSLKGLQPDCCYWLEKRAAQGCFLAWSRLPAAFTTKFQFLRLFRWSRLRDPQGCALILEFH